MKWSALLLAFLWAGSLPARTILPVTTDPNAHVDIRVECCFDVVPPCGYAPVEITVNNSSGQVRTWSMRFLSPSYSYPTGPAQLGSAGAVTVEPSATRTAMFLVPLSPAQNLTNIGVIVSGYGIPFEMPTMIPALTPNGKPTTPAMAVSKGAARELGDHLQKTADEHGQQLYTSGFDAGELPEDWRALIGFNGLWLYDDEWKGVSAAQRAALEDWILLGGKLFVCTKGPALSVEKRGMGSVVSVSSQNLDRARTFREWSELTFAEPPSLLSEDLRSWPAGAGVGSPSPNLPLLIGFLGIFASVIGPVNLFVLAKEGRRSRLFWTTPLISLGASAVLLILILVQDGFGGWGIRNALICLVPSQRKAVVFQEQMARTGMLASSSFSLRDPAWLSLLNISGPLGRGRKLPTLESSGVRFAGEWFKSRSLQAHWIESILPTRAEIALVNAAEARDRGASPAMVSSIDAPLSELWFWDAHGDSWVAHDVRTGVRTVLARSPWPKTILSQARLPLRGLLDERRGSPGSFVAVTSDAGSFIDSLPSIRWQNRQAVYVGPVTGLVLPP